MGRLPRGSAPEPPLIPAQEFLRTPDPRHLVEAETSGHRTLNRLFVFEPGDANAIPGQNR